MAFSKTFPKTTDKSVYPKWVEIFLTAQEELEIEGAAREENKRLMGACIDDALMTMREKKLHPNPPEVISIAITLFEKRASHSVFWKESKCKEKFDAMN